MGELDNPEISARTCFRISSVGQAGLADISVWEDCA
jgi:hypothetical protein